MGKLWSLLLAIIIGLGVFGVILAAPIIAVIGSVIFAAAVAWTIAALFLAERDTD